VAEEILQKRTINPHEKVTLSADSPKVILKLDYSASIKHLVTTLIASNNSSFFMAYPLLILHFVSS